ncbi:MAG: CBS domain-containing protein [Deltaproteobacteria bacterium]|nr:CBS domain-containing protein [Deltaproteobacteria bacterium]
MSEFEDAYEDDEQQVRGAILTQPVRGLEPAEPVCVQATTTLREAVEAMNRVKAGCVLVTGGERLVGILTERDILRHVVGKLDLDEPVTSVMTKNPETVGMEHGIAYALNKMHVGGYRHIPIIDAGGRPVGIISVRDIVGFIVSLFPSAVLNVPPEPELGIPRTEGGA